MSRLIFDVETDGLLPEMTKIHCICVTDPDLGKDFSFPPWGIVNAIKMLEGADEIIGHNIIDFDIPAIRKVYPKFKTKKITDTLLISRLVFPDIYEKSISLWKRGVLSGNLLTSHSLKAWGIRLGVLKGNFGETTDWSEYSQSMLDYCEQDVVVTSKLYELLMSKADGMEQAIELEHSVAHIIRTQELHGILFDKGKAEELYRELSTLRQEMKSELQEIFPPLYLNKGDFVPKRDNRNRGYRKGCKCTKVKLTQFNPSSRDHIAHWLKHEYGWEPTIMTPKGKPQVDEYVLDRLPYDPAPLLSKYFSVNKLLGMLGDGRSSWLKKVDSDDRIHGRVNTCGAVTGRMTHSSPNMAQVPANDKPYGERCRELFIVPPNYKLVGCDASGLELRCLAHYMARYDGGDYARTILEGDIHTVNQQAVGLPTRDDAKTFIYAFIYGAGNAKLGSIVGKTAKEGRRLRDNFLSSLPALAKLKEQVSATLASRGFLRGLDGRKLKCRNEYSALNTLLQSAGAVIMKQALVRLNDMLLCYGNTVNFVANVHDEWQIEVPEEWADEVGRKAVQAIQMSGTDLLLRCPLDAEYRIGNNWKETH